MKRIISVGLIASLVAMSSVGCTKTNTTKESAVTSSNTENAQKDLNLNIEERGQGKFYLVNSTGTTENGNIIYEFLDNEDTIITQLGYEGWDMNPNKVTYIYLDGKLIEKQVMSDTQLSLNLQKDALTYGTHTVEALQFKDGENLSDDNIEFYAKAQYVVTNNASEYEKGVNSNASTENNTTDETTTSNLSKEKEDILSDILNRALLGEISPEEMAEEVKKNGITEKEFEKYTEEWNNAFN